MRNQTVGDGAAAEQLVREGHAIEYPGPRPRLKGPPVITMKQRRRAIAKYSRAAEIAPRFIRAYVSRAHARRAIGDHAGARHDAAVAYRLRPGDPMTYLQLATASDRSVQRRILRSGIARAAPGSWEHFHLGWYSAQTYWYEGRFDLQVRAANRLVRRFKKLRKSELTAGLHYQAGTALMAMGKYAAAERRMREAAIVAKAPDALTFLAMVECRVYRGDLAGALTVLDEVANRLGTRDASITRTYVLALDPRSAPPNRNLVKRLSSTSTWGTSTFMGAVVLHRAGRADLARPRLRAFIQRCESNPREWGVTRRWEIAKAKQLLKSIGN